jgi:hypothetical protein
MFRTRGGKAYASRSWYPLFGFDADGPLMICNRFGAGIFDATIMPVTANPPRRLNWLSIGHVSVASRCRKWRDRTSSTILQVLRAKPSRAANNTTAPDWQIAIVRNRPNFRMMMMRERQQVRTQSHLNFDPDNA